MSKKQKSTTNSTQKFDTTTTPIAPAGTNEALQGLFGTVSNIKSLNPYDLVSGSNQWLDEAGKRAMTFGNESRQALAGLDGLLSGGAAQAQASSGLDNLKAWFNPYEDRVIKNALASFDEDAAAQSAAEDLQLAGSDAFSGSGGAIAKALFDKNRVTARGNLDANLRYQGFNTAAGFSSQDADRATQVSMTNANLAQQDRALQAQAILQKAGLLGDLEGQGIGILGDVGEAFRGMDTEYRTAPLMLAGFEADLLGRATPLAGLLTGQHSAGTQSGTQTTTSKVSDPLGGLGSALMGLGSLGFNPLGGISLGGLFGSAAKSSLGGKALGYK